MSLEDALRENTAAIKSHTEALNKFLAQGGKAGASASTGGDKKPADKPADKKPADKKPADKKKAPTLETIQKEFGEYLSVTDKAERAERKANIAKINEHFGVERATLLDPSDYEEALGYLRAYVAGDEPEFAERDGDEGDGDGEEESPI